MFCLFEISLTRSESGSLSLTKSFLVAHTFKHLFFFLSISPLQNSASVSFCQARAKWNSSACDWKAWLNCTNGKLCSYANRVSKRSMVFSRHNLYFPNPPPLLLKDCYSPPPNPNITPPPLLLQASFCPQLFGPIKSKLAAKLWRKHWDSPAKIKLTINKHPPKYTMFSPTSIFFLSP